MNELEEVKAMIESLQASINELYSRVDDLEYRDTKLNKLPMLHKDASVHELVSRVNNIIYYLNKGIEDGKIS